MSVTTTGAQFKAFYNDPKIWGATGSDESWYVEDLFVVINGRDADMDEVHNEHGDMFERLPDDAIVEIETGDICWQGRGEAPKREYDIVRAFERWEKDQSVVTVVATFELPKAWSAAQRGKLVNVLEALGAKSVAGVSGGDMDANERQALERVLAQIVGVDLASAPTAPSAERKRSPSPR